jgi:ribosomal protein L35
VGEEGTFIYIPGSKLCEYLNAADSKEEQALGKHVFDKEVKKRKRSETPPEEMKADDEARYAEQMERAAKRADIDMDYEEKSSTRSLSD